MINSPEHAEMAVDIACRNALGRRGVSHLDHSYRCPRTKTKRQIFPS